MRRTLLLVGILLLSIITAHAEIFESKFGFKATIPSDWLILTAEELKKNPDLFNTSHESFKNVDKNVLKDAANRVRQGTNEIYLHKGKGSNRGFTENINVFKVAGRLPRGEPECRVECAKLPAGLSKMFGKSIKLYQCGLRKAASLPALYAEFDGIINGTRSLSYQIQWSPNFVLVFTATCANQRLDIMRKMFNDIVNSVH